MNLLKMSADSLQAFASKLSSQYEYRYEKKKEFVCIKNIFYLYLVFIQRNFPFQFTLIAATIASTFTTALLLLNCSSSQVALPYLL